MTNSCPVCGEFLHTHPKTRNLALQCREHILRAIDAAHTRDTDQEEPARTPYCERLADGFALMALSEQ